MICEESEHNWRIAWENSFYSIAEVTCEKCGLVFQFSIPRGNGHNGHFKEKESETPGYRAREWQKSLQRLREHPERIKSNQNREFQW